MHVLKFSRSIWSMVMVTVLGFTISFALSQTKNAQDIPDKSKKTFVSEVQPANASSAPQPEYMTAQQHQAELKRVLDSASAESRRKETSSPLLIWYGLLLVVFIFALHSIDSIQAYGSKKQILAKYPDKLVHNQIAVALRELSKSSAGIPGTTRSILTYSLFIILGISVFYLLVVSSTPESNKMADNILTILSGSLASILGFYFGAKATQEGNAGKTPAPETQPAHYEARISQVSPNIVKQGDIVTIEGAGFGKDMGSVYFGNVQAQPAEIIDWTDGRIKVKVPTNAAAGAMDVYIAAKSGEKTAGYKVSIK